MQDISTAQKDKPLHGSLPLKNITELEPWDTVDVDLIGPYSKSIRQQHLGGAIINNNFCLAFMTIIDPAIGWFEIFKVPMFDIFEVTGGNDEYIDNLSYRVSHLFNNTWLCRYSCPHKFMFYNGSDFKSSS